MQFQVDAGDSRPTFFELVATDRLVPSLRAALVYSLRTLAERRPGVTRIRPRGGGVRAPHAPRRGALLRDVRREPGGGPVRTAARAARGARGGWGARRARRERRARRARGGRPGRTPPFGRRRRRERRAPIAEDRREAATALRARARGTAVRAREAGRAVRAAVRRGRGGIARRPGIHHRRGNPGGPRAAGAIVERRAGSPGRRRRRRARGTSRARGFIADARLRRRRRRRRRPSRGRPFEPAPPPRSSARIRGSTRAGRPSCSGAGSGTSSKTAPRTIRRWRRSGWPSSARRRRR